LNTALYGQITSAIKFMLKLKLKSYCSYNKQHFVVAKTKMLMRAATVVQVGQGDVDGHDVQQGRRATAGGTG